MSRSRDDGRSRGGIREPGEREIEVPEIHEADSREGVRLVRLHVPEYEDNILVEEVAALRADDQVLVPSVHHVDRLGPVVSNDCKDSESVRNRRAVGCLRGTLVLEWERGNRLGEGVGSEDSGGEGGHCQQDYAFGVSDKCCQCLIYPHIPVLRLRCAALRTNGGRNPALQLLLPSTPLCCAQDERREESGPSTPLCCAQDERREESCPSTPASFDSAVLRSGRTEGGILPFNSCFLRLRCAALRTNGGRNPALQLLLPSTPLCCAQDERREESCPSTPASFDSAVLRSGRTEGRVLRLGSARRGVVHCFL